MCTLILGRDVVAGGTMILGANRDEDPARPAEPPGVLRDHPRVVGGRDVRAGGTWLAVRERRLVVAMLNRRDASGGPAGPRADRRSRGLLAIDAAAADAGADAFEHARELATRDPYAPFSMVLASARSCWWIAHDGNGAPRALEVAPGWHVLTHMDLDDTREPRTAWLMETLAGFRPAGPEPASARLRELLGTHGDGVHPAVCLHQGPIVSVSSSLVWMTAGEARYLHAEGRPCQSPFQDYSALLVATAGNP